MHPVGRTSGVEDANATEWQLQPWNKNFVLFAF